MAKFLMLTPAATEYFRPSHHRFPAIDFRKLVSFGFHWHDISDRSENVLRGTSDISDRSFHGGKYGVIIHMRSYKRRKNFYNPEVGAIQFLCPYIH